MVSERKPWRSLTVSVALLVLTLVTLLAGFARAEVVADLYAGVVPVPDQGSKALAVASADALSQVLVKVSGTEAILDNTDIRAGLSQARSQVQQYSYLAPGQEGEDLHVRIEFDADFVRQMVIGAGEPLWTANRPAVLAWLALDDGRGRRFLTADGDPELVRELRSAFSRRGVPLQLPLYDLADATSVAMDDVWQLNGPALQSASLRYAVEHIVGARMTLTADGQWQGDWAYFSGLDRYDRRIRRDSTAAFMADGVALVGQQMAARYAVLPTGLAPVTVPLVVSGISRFADYASLVTWLEQLELVGEVRLRRLAGERLELGLDARADATQLATLLELNRNLVPVAPPGPGQPLEYLWQK